MVRGGGPCAGSECCRGDSLTTEKGMRSVMKKFRKPVCMASTLARDMLKAPLKLMSSMNSHVEQVYKI